MLDCQLAQHAMLQHMVDLPTHLLWSLLLPTNKKDES